MLGTEGKEDAGAVVGERAGIVGLQMIGAHVIGWGVGEMVAGIGLHRIYFEHILRGRRPEQIELGTLVGVVVDGGCSDALVGVLIAAGGALEVAFYMAEDAEFILLAR